MTTQDWIVMTGEQCAAATVLDDADQRLGARFVDNPEAGAIFGKWVAPARLLSDLDYARWRPVLGGLDVVAVEATMLFLPSPDEI